MNRLDLSAALWDGALLALSRLWQLAYIIIPLFMALEVVRSAGWMKTLARVFTPVLRPLQLPPAAGVPLATLLIFGVSIGSGVLLEHYEKGELTRRHVMVLAALATVCHALPDESAVFIPLGARVWIGLLIRLVLGLGFALAAARLLPRTYRDPAASVECPSAR